MTKISDSVQDAQHASMGPRKRSGAASKPKVPKPDKPEKPGRPTSKWAAELWDWTRTLSIALTVVLLLHFFVFNLSTVEGQSMEPTLYEGGWLFVNKFSYLIGDPDRGEVVILKDPTDRLEKKEYLVKRVVGVPGDTIEIREGLLYRNGELIVESYTDTVIDDLDFGPYKVDEGMYFVMGDNRHARASLDSRSFGAVSQDLIRGRADFILWPIAKLNAL